jgi:hypothetical protein
MASWKLFRGTKQLVVFEFVEEFKSEQLSTRVRSTNYSETSLHDALAKLPTRKLEPRQFSKGNAEALDERGRLAMTRSVVVVRHGNKML